MAPDPEQGFRRDHPQNFDSAEWAIPENEIVGFLILLFRKLGTC